MFELTDIIAYTIIIVAILLSIWLIYRNLAQKKACNIDQCGDCPVAKQCKKPQNLDN